MASTTPGYKREVGLMADTVRSIRPGALCARCLDPVEHHGRVPNGPPRRAVAACWTDAQGRQVWSEKRQTCSCVGFVVGGEELLDA